MANIDKLIPIILRWEGHYVDDPLDRGGATNMGITLATWQRIGYDKNHDGHIDKEDVKQLDYNDFKYVFKSYWNTWLADSINNQSIANILVDWVWGSGRWGVIIPQRILGVKPDGSVGPKTLQAVNDYQPQEELFNKIKQARIDFVNDICKHNPTQKRFLKGWLNRINSYTFTA